MNIPLTVRNFIIIVILGALGIWKSVPVGFLLEMDPVRIVIATVSGAAAAVMLLYLLGSKVKSWATERMGRNGMKKRARRISILFDKYGALGVGLIGSLVIGPNMAMVLGLAVVRSEKKLLYATLAGVVIWTSLLTILTYSGIDLVRHLN